LHRMQVWRSRDVLSRCPAAATNGLAISRCFASESTSLLDCGRVCIRHHHVTARDRLD
jgi:hypothetical protein